MTEDDKAEMAAGSNNTPPDNGLRYSIAQIYLKDVSFETPNSPEIFTEDFKPKVEVQLNTGTTELEAGIYEVVLSITVTAQSEQKTGFLVEVQQAGIFKIDTPNDERLPYILGVACPNNLFPFAREAISDLVVKGGFPQLLLAPINFRALYREQVEKTKASA